jgi:pimeloyl-ACP methyl ester carboxylesterase
MAATPQHASLAGVTHHYAKVNGTRLHYVAAGSEGSPVLLVHGFPETWWTFRKLIPLLASSHRVFAVDLRGFGDSDHGAGTYDSKASAEDLHLLIDTLNLGPVHLTGQDISGATVFRLAATHPDDVLSFSAIEMGLPGFGLEMLADITHGGSWHIGVLAAPNIPEMLLTGREREFLGQFAFPAMSATPGAITRADIDEFVRTYSRPDGWRGAIGLYQSMLQEGEDIGGLVAAGKLRMPVLAIGAGGGEFTFATMTQVAADPVRSISLEGVGHYAALEAPGKLADALVDFFKTVDAA